MVGGTRAGQQEVGRDVLVEHRHVHGLAARPVRVLAGDQHLAAPRGRQHALQRCQARRVVEDQQPVPRAGRPAPRGPARPGHRYPAGHERRAGPPGHRTRPPAQWAPRPPAATPPLARPGDGARTPAPRWSFPPRPDRTAPPPAGPPRHPPTAGHPGPPADSPGPPGTPAAASAAPAGSALPAAGTPLGQQRSRHGRRCTEPGAVVQVLPGAATVCAGPGLVGFPGVTFPWTVPAATPPPDAVMFTSRPAATP